MYKTDSKDSLIEMYHYRVEALQSKIEFLEAQLEVNKINEEFLWRASFPVHKYNTKKIMVYINKL